MSSAHGGVYRSIGDCRRTIDGLRAGTGWCDTLALIFELLKLVHASSELSLSLFFLY